MKFVVGCDLEEFKRYYRKSSRHSYYKTVGITDTVSGELGPTEENHIRRDPSHLIVWRENNRIIGNAIWHEESIDGFSDPEDREIREALERLLEGKRQFIELHEVWIEEEHRGKGYGKQFFDFFEDFIRKKGHSSIVYYTGNPAAIAICRKRGYQEEILSYAQRERWHVFHLKLNSPHLKTPKSAKRIWIV